ncbi:MAG: oxygenase MpaB family protein [Actinomycetota bacterium]
MIGDAVDQLRSEAAGAVRRLLAGTDEPPDRGPEDRTDDGWFGPGSATWTVHSDLSMLVGGVRALLLQTLHPGAMAGVADHSNYREDPLGRLHRTGAFVGATTFGTAAEAEAAVEMVKAVHRRVVGTTPEGVPYTAADPRLLLWVHATEVDSFLRAYRRYGAEPIAPPVQDRYVAEMGDVAERLGATEVPRSVAELRSTLQGFRPELRAGAQARETVRFLVLPPGPLLAKGPYAVVLSAAVTLLPRWVRWELRLPVLPLSEQLAVRPATTALLRTLGWVLGPHEAVAAADQAVGQASTN